MRREQVRIIDFRAYRSRRFAKVGLGMAVIKPELGTASPFPCPAALSAPPPPLSHRAKAR